MDVKVKHQKRIRRHKRVRAKIFGTKQVPRLCVFRSNKHIYAQLIDDEKEKTLAAASDLEIKKSKVTKKVQAKSKKPKEETEQVLKRKVLIAYNTGQLIAQKALKNKIKKVVFDRGGNKYHGRVKALAEGARASGLEF